MASSSSEHSAVVVVGGKGSSLSPAAVDAISRRLSKVTIDSSALEKVSKSKKPSSSPLKESPSNPRFLSPEDSLAALAVLLNKLLLSDASVGSSLPLLIEETLNLACSPETLDFGSPFRFLDSLCRLNGKKLDEIRVGAEEIGAFEHSCTASSEICAILDGCSSALVKVSDAVAALSCEAVGADVFAFDLPVSGDGFSVTDETDVAAAMEEFLSGSKLVGRNDAAPFTEIPAVHGSFREAVRLLHGRIRVELNSSIKFKKAMNAGNYGKEKALVTSALPLAMSI